MSDFTVEEWRNYISKLIDRNFQKQRNSGVTGWIILTAIAYVILTILSWNYSPEMFREEEFLFVFLKAINLLFLGEMVYEGVKDELIEDCGEETRIKPVCSKKTENLEGLVSITYAVLGVLVNAYCGIGLYLSLNKIYYSLIWVTLLFVLVILSSVPKIDKKKLDLIFSNDLASKKFVSTVSLLLIILGYFVLRIPINVENAQILGYLKLSLYVILLVKLFAFYFKHNQYNSEREFLTDLEKDIVLHQMTQEEIRRVFVEEYWGDTIQDINLKWLSKESAFGETFNNVKAKFRALKKSNESEEELKNELKRIRSRVIKDYRELSAEYKRVIETFNSFKEGNEFWAIARFLSPKQSSWKDHTAAYKKLLKSMQVWSKEKKLE